MHKTRVALSPDYIATHEENGKKINRYAWFSHKFWDDNGKCFYVFYLDRTGQNSIAHKYEPYVKISAGDIEIAISEIIKEVEAPEGYNALSVPVELQAGEGMRSFVIYADEN